MENMAEVMVLQAVGCQELAAHYQKVGEKKHGTNSSSQPLAEKEPNPLTSFLDFQPLKLRQISVV
jgi:hypothetical protein